MNSKCPEGQLCFNREIFFFLVILITGIVVWFFIHFNEQLNGEVYISKKKKANKEMDNYYYLDDNDKNKSNSIPNTGISISPIINQSESIKPNNIPFNTNSCKQPFVQPVETLPTIINDNRNIHSEPRRSLPINIPTRGYQTQFSQVGILHNKNKKKGNIILPLYGKQLYPGSSKWQYYVTTDGYNSIKIDIKFKDKSGLSEYGCEEISDQDIVKVPSYRQAFVANIYHLDKPSYIPYIN